MVEANEFAHGLDEICRFLEVDEFRYIPGKVRHTNEMRGFVRICGRDV